MMRILLLLSATIVVGCSTARDLTVSIGMPQSQAIQNLFTAGARPVILQRETEDGSNVYEDYRLPDRALLRIGFNKTDRRVSILSLLKKPDPKHGKTLGRSELVKVIDLNEQGSQQAESTVPVKAAPSASSTAR